MIIALTVGAAFYERNVVQEELINQVGRLIGQESAKEIENILLHATIDAKSTFARIVGGLTLAISATASSWLIDASGTRVLLTHHRKLDRWLQPGGHADGDGDLASVALREAEEETGLPGLRIEGGVFDLDRHAIPARGSEPEHFHYDVRYVVRAGADEAFVVNEESHALKWLPVAKSMLPCPPARVP